ncbi:MAG: hypothetical protein WCA35_15845, partial [Kovacikia sp.]
MDQLFIFLQGRYSRMNREDMDSEQRLPSGNLQEPEVRLNSEEVLSSDPIPPSSALQLHYEVAMPA